MCSPQSNWHTYGKATRLDFQEDMVPDNNHQIHGLYSRGLSQIKAENNGTQAFSKSSLCLVGQERNSRILQKLGYGVSSAPPSIPDM